MCGYGQLDFVQREICRKYKSKHLYLWTTNFFEWIHKYALFLNLEKKQNLKFRDSQRKLLSQIDYPIFLYIIRSWRKTAYENLDWSKKNNLP
jgi:hypothetical protein